MSDFDWIIGVDEVGAGCLAGPVVAAAFAYPLSEQIRDIVVPVRVYDSKALSEKARALSREWLLAWEPGQHKIVEISAQIIDEINILRARFRAMHEAVSPLLEEIPREARVGIFVDGSVAPPEMLGHTSSRVRITPVVKGDAKVFAIAAASILAKEHRDQLMVALAKEFPHFGWDQNVGYPTIDHKEGLRRVGPTPWHRRSFQWDREANEESASR